MLLDPVGAGASGLRTDTARGLLAEIPFAAVRGNASEIKTLAVGSGATPGVDAAAADALGEDTIASAVAMARGFARQTGAVVIITGAVDLVTNADDTLLIRNGHPL